MDMSKDPAIYSWERLATGFKRNTSLICASYFRCPQTSCWQRTRPVDSMRNTITLRYGIVARSWSPIPDMPEIRSR